MGGISILRCELSVQVVYDMKKVADLAYRESGI